MKRFGATLLLVLAGCSGTQNSDSGSATRTDTGDLSTGDTADTGDTDPTGDTADTGATQDTSDSGSVEDTATTTPVDLDSDGYASDVDCDDGDPDVHPGADEICDGIDNDCSADTPEENLVTLSDGTTTSTIQAAVDAASSGDTVLICPGTYGESVVVEKALSLVSSAGSEQTILDAGDPSPNVSTLVIRSKDLVTVEGLTITGGNGTREDGGYWGGGIHAGQSGGVEVRDCVVTGNTADYAAGILGTDLYPASDLLVDTVLETNVASEAGGGFLLFHARLEGVEVRDNEAAYGGGGSVWNGSLTADSATLLENNRASNAGGGIYLYDAATWSGGEITGNSATEQGGGVMIVQSGKFKDATVTSNDTAGAGGGFAIEGEQFSLLNVVLADNSASLGAGLAASDTNGNLEALQFDRHAASKLGGGLYLTGSTTLTATTTRFSKSTPDDISLSNGSDTTSYESAKTSDFSCEADLLTCTWR